MGVEGSGEASWRRWKPLGEDSLLQVTETNLSQCKQDRGLPYKDLGALGQPKGQMLPVLRRGRGRDGRPLGSQATCLCVGPPCLPCSEAWLSLLCPGAGGRAPTPTAAPSKHHVHPRHSPGPSP